VSRLELKLPPDAVWVMVAGLMWLASNVTPKLATPSAIRIAAGATCAVLGIFAIVIARAALAQADTTWRPMTPAKATKLVTSGIYRLSRNPTYLGMLLVLISLAVLLASPAALLISTGFVVYLDRFQIAPEERALAKAFGQEYAEYRARVRRWI
jgi:protein-S-isoprenylcysteine O-methyltransferase Ste14